MSTLKVNNIVAYSGTHVSGTFSGVFSGSFNSNRIDALEAFSSSLDNTFATDLVVNSLSGAFNSFTAALDNTYATDAQLLPILQATRSIELTTGSLIGITNGLMAFTAALDSTYATDEQLYQLYQATASLQQFSSSIQSEVDDIKAWTASLELINTIDTELLQILQTTASLNSKTGSYATTGSNVFSGSQYISGSVYVSGGLDIKNNGYSWSFDSNGKTRIPNITFNSDRGTGMVGIKPVEGREFQIETSTAVSSAGPWVFGLDGTLSAPNGANILRVGNLVTTSSFNTFTSSVNSFSASVNEKTGSYATTGSNEFNGNQNITGSLNQGLGNTALGEYSHAEGDSTQAIGLFSHAEGLGTIAYGGRSHAEGQDTIASGSYSHAEGKETIALADHQHVQGQYNFVSPVQSAFIVGNGTDAENRSNLIYAAENAVEITGSLNVTGSVNIDNVIKLTPVTNFPTGQAGMLVASASYGKTNLYVYDGSDWKWLVTGSIA
jgi:hypothetical protein